MLGWGRNQRSPAASRAGASGCAPATFVAFWTKGMRPLPDCGTDLYVAMAFPADGLHCSAGLVHAVPLPCALCA